MILVVPEPSPGSADHTGSASAAEEEQPKHSRGHHAKMGATSNHANHVLPLWMEWPRVTDRRPSSSERLFCSPLKLEDAAPSLLHAPTPTRNSE
jgi:hypothetical protein